jgi:hypothetical protein
MSRSAAVVRSARPTDQFGPQRRDIHKDLITATVDDWC